LDKSKLDHVMSSVKALANLVPGPGGLVASLIGDYVPTSTQRRIEEGMEEFKKQIERLEERISPDSVDKEMFAELFKTCYLVMARTHQSSKIRAAARIMANVLLSEDDPERLTFSELDHYARCIENLSSGAIEALANLVLVAQEFRSGDPETDRIRVQFEDLQKKMPATDPDLLMGLVGELNAVNLIHVNTPGVTTPDYGNYPITVNPIGTRLSIHLLGPE